MKFIVKLFYFVNNYISGNIYFVKIIKEDLKNYKNIKLCLDADVDSENIKNIKLLKEIIVLDVKSLDKEKVQKYVSDNSFFDSFDYVSNFSMYKIAMENKNFYLAYYFRQNGIKILKQMGISISTPKVTALRIFLANIESRDYENSSEILKTIEKFFNTRLYSKLKTYFLVTFKPNQIKGPKSQGISRQSFLNLKNKTIAIVGPSYHKEKSNQKIDIFDAVIYINVMNEENIDASEKTKKNITYLAYGASAFRHNMKKILSIQKKNNELFVLKKNHNHRWNLKYFLSSRSGRVEKLYDPNIFFVHGKSYLVPIIILHLILNHVDKVVLFNVDFYSKKKIYKDGYLNGEYDSYNRDGLLKQYAFHDIFSNINITRNLSKSGFVEFADTSLNLNETDNIEYIQNLYEIYGK